MAVPIRYEKILDFATAAHAGQKRKYTDQDYITHPIEVARIVKEQGGDDNMIYAALLHDVLEDTPVTHAELRTILHNILSIQSAENVLSLVVELTDVYTKEAFPQMNRKMRKGFEALRLAYASGRAKAIKRADIEHNSESIMEHDPKFAKVFLEEKKNLLEKMSLIVA
jgi:guanosine-3',5'-bis(diphosphate) 3'-pyrophosphohydrolase